MLETQRGQVEPMTVNSILMPDTHPAYEQQLQELYEQASQELCFDRFCSTAAAVPNAMLHVAESSLVSLGGSVERLHSYVLRRVSRNSMGSHVHVREHVSFPEVLLLSP